MCWRPQPALLRAACTGDVASPQVPLLSCLQPTYLAHAAVLSSQTCISPSAYALQIMCRVHPAGARFSTSKRSQSPSGSVLATFLVRCVGLSGCRQPCSQRPACVPDHLEMWANVCLPIAACFACAAQPSLLASTFLHRQASCCQLLPLASPHGDLAVLPHLLKTEIGSMLVVPTAANLEHGTHPTGCKYKQAATSTSRP